MPSSPGQFCALLDGELDAALTSPDNVLAYRFSPTNPLGAHRRRPDRGGCRPRPRPGAVRAGRAGRQLRGGTFGVDVPGSGFAFAMYALAESVGARPGRLRAGSPRLHSEAAARRCCAASATATMLNAGNELHAEAAGYGGSPRCAGPARPTSAPSWRWSATPGWSRPAGWPPRWPGPRPTSSPAGSTDRPSPRPPVRSDCRRHWPSATWPGSRTRPRGSCRTAWSTRPRSDDRGPAPALPAGDRQWHRPVRPGAGGRIGPAGRVLMAAPAARPTTEPDRSSLRLLQLTSFVSTLDRFAMPSMLLAISRRPGRPLPSVVTAASVYYIAYGPMQPVWGIVSDRLGRVRTLRVTLLLAAVATAVVGAVARRRRADRHPRDRRRAVRRGDAGLPDLRRRHGAAGTGSRSHPACWSASRSVRRSPRSAPARWPRSPPGGWHS